MGNYILDSENYIHSIKRPIHPMRFNLDSIIIFTRNVDQLKAFYTGAFGLTVLEEYQSEWVLLKAGKGKIGLHQIGKQYLEAGAGATESHHNTKIVFEVDEDLHALRQTLIAKNIRMREVVKFDNSDFFLCDGEDPEGNVFQLKKSI
jgi:catechol 2,3-dioxygenase-like lactoylglutathione lyase family enzyme